MHGIRTVLVGSLLIGCAAPGDDGGSDDVTGGEFLQPPVQGDAEAPLLSSLSFRCHEVDSIACGTGCLAFSADMTDPDGLADIEDLEQVMRIYPDAEGAGVPVQIGFYLYDGTVIWDGSYYTGQVFYGPESAPTRAAACAASWWPTEVSMHDASGHVTIARVRATRVQ